MSSRNRNPYQIKGVNALFGETEPTETEERSLPLAQLTPFERQPRRYFDPDKLEKIVASVKKHGILEPLLVRPKPDGLYEVVAGGRRFKAAAIAGLSEAPVVIRELSDEEAFEIALLENLQREDLNPIEETEGILELLSIRLGTNQEGVVALLSRAAHPERNTESVDNVIHSQEWQVVQNLFDIVGRFTPESFRTNRLPLLKMPVTLLTALREGKIEYTKARAIARVKDDEQRSDLLETAIREDLSLTQIKEKIGEISRAKADRTEKEEPGTLRTRLDAAYKQVKKSKIWNNPTKQARLESALKVLEDLLSEE